MNITYFLGAGASYNALPTYVRQDDEFYRAEELNNVTLDETSKDDNGNYRFDSHNFLHRLILFRRKFWIKVGSTISPISQTDTTKQFLYDLDWLINQLFIHTSIDTVAKKLYVTNNEPYLNRLKGLVSCFFTYEQLTKHYDQRYDTFLASIVEKTEGELALNDNVKIITWNYDIQFEIAFQNYFSTNLALIQRKLNTYPFIKQDGKSNFDDEKFGIIRLNGMAVLKTWKEQFDL